MSIFSKIKELFSLPKQIREFRRKNAEMRERYLNMSSEELSSLSDEELFVAVLMRTENIVDGAESIEAGLAAINKAQRVFYSVGLFESEVDNGGLCQFFINSSRAVAPVVGEYMGLIGADEHKKLYEDFIDNNGIDTRDLSFFDIEKVSEFEEKNSCYPFNEYDDAFYELEPLTTYLKKYAREHAKEL